MEKFIIKYIDYNKCYFYLLLIGFLWIISVALDPVKAIPQKPFQAVVHTIELFLTLYVYLGFVKFSLIAKQVSFRKLIIAAMALSIVQSSIVMIATLVNKELFSLNGVAFVMECILLFYAFKSVQDMKISNFKRISRLYLYLSFLLIPIFTALLLGKDGLSTLPRVLIPPLTIIALVAGVIIVNIWYLKMRAFKQISMPMY
jgi:hypothetical protein